MSGASIPIAAISTARRCRRMPPASRRCRDVVRVFFNGSAAGAASALLGMSDKLDTDQLDELEQMIAKARAAKGGR